MKALIILGTLCVAGVLSRAYEYLMYSQIFERIKVLNALDPHNIISPELQQVPYGGDCIIDNIGTKEPCKYMVVKVTNYNKTGEEIATLPQILIVGGFFGTDRLSPTSIVETMQNMIDNLEEYRNILNSAVLLFVPVASPGAYSTRQYQESDVTTVTDYPLFYNNDASPAPCMKSRSARFLTSLLKSNLISTAMVLSVSSSDMTKLTRPFMGSLTTSMLPSDLLWTNKLLNGIYNNLRTSMIKAGNVAIKEPANLFVAYFVKLRTLWEQKDSFQISSTEVLVFSQGDQHAMQLK